MNKTEVKLAKAIQNFKYLNYGNTSIQPVGNILKVYLHGSVIAEYNRKTQQLKLTDAGWCTKTTVSRLNMVLQAFGLSAIYARMCKGTTQFYLDNYMFGKTSVEFNQINL